MSTLNFDPIHFSSFSFKPGAVVSDLQSFRDRLRAVECPSEIIDELGGWSTAGVGSNYGRGFSLELKARYMKMIARRF